MQVKVKVNDKLCIGSGSCIVIASEHFELNKKGKAELKSSEREKTKGSELVLNVTSSDRKRLLEAAQACPAQAITIIGEKGEKIY